jgi:CRISPR/Cas system-associated endoribonuclease Cas2
VLHLTVQYSILLFSTPIYCSVLHFTVQYSIHNCSVFHSQHCCHAVVGKVANNIQKKSASYRILSGKRNKAGKIKQLGKSGSNIQWNLIVFRGLSSKTLPKIPGRVEKYHNRVLSSLLTGVYQQYRKWRVCGFGLSPHSSVEIYPLNAELNPICHLLALLGAHHILHVSRIRVKKAWNCRSIPVHFCAWKWA